MIITKKQRKSHFVFGLGFGDEGKGTMIDFLSRRYKNSLIIRYNGGSQAGHNVTTSEGKHHIFSQIGSGSFFPLSKTLLSRFVFIDPISLANEIAEFSPKINEHALNRHFVDSRAPIITPFHVATNCLKEIIRGKERHGSCGKGFGEAVSDSINFPGQTIRILDLLDKDKTILFLKMVKKRKLKEIKDFGLEFEIFSDETKRYLNVLLSEDEPEKISLAYQEIAKEINIVSPNQIKQMINFSTPIFEGAQGILLDEWHGFHPYTTWSTISPKNAFEILKEAGFSGENEITGVIRTHYTRHGAGPFPTENQFISRRNVLNEYNIQNDWQKNFRFGCFDEVMLRYAIECLRKTTGISNIALTHADLFSRLEKVPYCSKYFLQDKELKEIKPQFENDLHYQEKISKLLFQAKPNVSFFRSLSKMISRIEKNSNIFVKYISSGPTASDKKIVK